MTRRNDGSPDRTGRSEERVHDDQRRQEALFNKKRAAFYLAVSPRTIDNLMAAGKPPFVRFSRRLVRFPKSALDELIRERLVNAK